MYARGVVDMIVSAIATIVGFYIFGISTAYVLRDLHSYGGVDVYYYESKWICVTSWAFIDDLLSRGRFCNVKKGFCVKYGGGSV